MAKFVDITCDACFGPGESGLHQGEAGLHEDHEDRADDHPQAGSAETATSVTVFGTSPPPS